MQLFREWKRKPPLPLNPFSFSLSCLSENDFLHYVFLFCFSVLEDAASAFHNWIFWFHSTSLQLKVTAYMHVVLLLLPCIKMKCCSSKKKYKEKKYTFIVYLSWLLMLLPNISFFVSSSKETWERGSFYLCYLTFLVSVREGSGMNVSWYIIL